MARFSFNVKTCLATKISFARTLFFFFETPRGVHAALSSRQASGCSPLLAAAATLTAVSPWMVPHGAAPPTPRPAFERPQRMPRFPWRVRSMESSHSILNALPGRGLLQGAREMAWIFDEYTKFSGFSPGIVTGKVGQPVGLQRVLHWVAPGQALSGCMSSCELCRQRHGDGQATSLQAWLAVCGCAGWQCRWHAARPHRCCYLASLKAFPARQRARQTRQPSPTHQLARPNLSPTTHTHRHTHTLGRAPPPPPPPRPLAARVAARLTRARGRHRARHRFCRTRAAQGTGPGRHPQ